jgi:uncharacterized protein YgiM (DUF1202 family)
MSVRAKENNMRRLKLLTASALTLSLFVAAGAASAQNVVQNVARGVTECEAVGGKQEVGALMGAAIGAYAGSKISKNERAAGALAGAAAGAAAGSWTGCKLQRDAAAKGLRAYKDDGSGSYASGGYRLASYVQAAPLRRGGGDYVATRNVNVRTSPGTRGDRIGGLTAGEPLQVIARSGEWMLVGRDGVGVGYVHSAYVRRV